MKDYNEINAIVDEVADMLVDNDLTIADAFTACAKLYAWAEMQLSDEKCVPGLRDHFFLAVDAFKTAYTCIN